MDKYLKLGEGRSQLVKEFGVIKLLAEDVSEEKAIKLHYLSHGDYLYSFIPTRNPYERAIYLGDQILVLCSKFTFNDPIWCIH